jgi:trehalose 6-phosphate phosphatase
MTSVDAVVEQALAVLAARPSALVTDVDGTLSRIVPNPQDAEVDEVISRALEELLMRLDLVAVVTGREESVARRMVGVEGLTYVGSYGMDASVAVRLIDSDLSSAREAVLPFLTRVPCVTLELKDVSFSLHYRNCDNPGEVRVRLLSLVEPIALSFGARVMEGKQVVEVVPEGLPTKASAMAHLLDTNDLRGAIFMGDDLADTVVFQEISRRRSENGLRGLSIAVLDEETDPVVRDAADTALQGVGEVELFLARLAARLAAQGVEP